MSLREDISQVIFSKTQPEFLPLNLAPAGQRQPHLRGEERLQRRQRGLHAPVHRQLQPGVLPVSRGLQAAGRLEDLSPGRRLPRGQRRLRPVMRSPWRRQGARVRMPRWVQDGLAGIQFNENWG